MQSTRSLRSPSASITTGWSPRLCTIFVISMALVNLFLGKSCNAFMISERQYRHRNQATPLAMAVGKTGSKVIESPDQYSEMVSKTSNTRPALIFWTAPWCGPCRLSAPVVKEVMKQFSGEIDVAEVCTDDLPEVAAEAGVVSIPTIQLWYGGKLRDTIIGCVAKSVLATAVEKVLEETTPQPKSAEN